MLAAVVFEDCHGVAVEADRAGPAALGSAFDALAAHDGSGAAEGDLGRVEVNGLPAELEQFAAPSAGVGGQAVEGEQPVILGSGQERAELVGRPNLNGLGGSAPRSLGSCGRIGGEQLLDVHGVSECLAERAVDVGDRGR